MTCATKGCGAPAEFHAAFPSSGIRQYCERCQARLVEIAGYAGMTIHVTPIQPPEVEPHGSDETTPDAAAEPEPVAKPAKRKGGFLRG